MSGNTVSSGAFSAYVTVSGGQTENVLNSGLAFSTTVEAGGALDLSGFSFFEQVGSGGSETVVSGGESLFAQIAGGTQTILDGGLASGASISSGGAEFVSSGGVASATTISNGGTQFIYQDGSAASAVVSSGGVEVVSSGGVASGTTILNGGSQVISTGGSATSAVVSSGGAEYVSSGGVASGTTISNGGSQFVYVSGSAVGAVVDSGGAEYVSLGGVASGTTVAGGGSEIVFSGGSAVGTVVSSGGVEVVHGGGVATSTTVEHGGEIDLADLKFSGGTANINGSDVLTVTEGANTYTQQLAGSYAGEVVSLSADAGGGTLADIVCFASGSAIRTVQGDVPVERLAIGDLVVTASGKRRPIRWIGHRKVDCRRQPIASEVMPIRIRAHAFGPEKPARDLWISPGHGICVDVVGQVLIPASALINSATVAQVDVDEVIYWHVELDSHDILLAENLPTESYLEMENRAFFIENTMVALDVGPDARPKTHDDFCRPFHVEGALVEVVRAQMRLRAKALGWTIEEKPNAGLHLDVDGLPIYSATDGPTACFAVPARSEDVWIVSDVSRLCDVSESSDPRRLGVCIGSLAIDDGFGSTVTIAPADPRLDEGFHYVEGPFWRWTNGRARLPAELFENCEDGFLLKVALVETPPPRWRAPPDLDSAGSQLVA